MDELKELIFFGTNNTPCNLAILASSAGFNVHFIENAIKTSDFQPQSKFILFASEHLLNTNKIFLNDFINTNLASYQRIIYDSNMDIESELSFIRFGVNGIISQKTGMDLSLKALMSINTDEQWFSRKTLEAAVSAKDLTVSGNNKSISIKLNSYLSLKEKITLELLTQGLTNQEIAEQMKISENTVKAHISSLYRKTNCRNRVELTKICM